MSPKAKHELARELLDQGLSAVDEGSELGALTFLHLALEAAVVSVAEGHGIDTKKRHDKKAKAAHDLYEQGVMPEDFSGLMRLLNQARKDRTYEGEEPDLEGHSLEDIGRSATLAVETAEGEAR
ncbi:MAG TPA: hypothetical protein VHG69_11605 [Thermoleophilaceae bacterium]|nr:hypothetical protein [Thermoleophilaceae bacterium]